MRSEQRGTGGAVTAAGRTVAPARLGSAIGALFAAQFAAASLPFGVGALAPYLSRNIGLSAGEIGLATAIIYALVVAGSVPAGRVVDRIGVSRGIGVSCLVIAGGGVGLAVAGSRVALAVSLGVIGLGYAAISPATNKGVVAVAPPRLRGRAMGIKQMGVTAGGAVAAALLPTSVARLGFGPTLAVMAAIVAGIGISADAWLRSLPAPIRGGAQARVADPRLRRRIVLLGVAIATMVAAQHCVATYLTLFLVDRRAMAPATAAGLLSLMLLSGTVARFGWGWVSDRMGSRLRTMVVIGSLSAACSLTLGLIGSSLPWAALVVVIVALGISTQGGNAVFQTAIAEEAPDRAGWASGIGMSLGFTGAILAPPVFGVTIDVTGSFTVALVAVAVLLTLGVVLTGRLDRVGRPSAHVPH